MHTPLADTYVWSCFSRKPTFKPTQFALGVKVSTAGKPFQQHLLIQLSQEVLCTVWAHNVGVTNIQLLFCLISEADISGHQQIKLSNKIVFLWVSRKHAPVIGIISWIHQHFLYNSDVTLLISGHVNIISLWPILAGKCQIKFSSCTSCMSAKCRFAIFLFRFNWSIFDIPYFPWSNFVPAVTFCMSTDSWCQKVHYELHSGEITIRSSTKNVLREHISLFLKL